MELIADIEAHNIILYMNVMAKWGYKMDLKNDVAAVYVAHLVLVADVENIMHESRYRTGEKMRIWN